MLPTIWNPFFNVLLFICTHLRGPLCDLSDPPLFGNSSQKVHQSPMKLWLWQTNFLALRHLKYGQLAGFFEMPGGHISSYFQPLQPHLIAFWHALHPQITPTTLPRGEDGIRSQAKPEKIIEIFKQALQDPILIDELKRGPNTLGKCSRPGELSSSPNGWDTIPTAKHLQGTTKLQAAPERLVGKRRKGLSSRQKI